MEAVELQTVNSRYHVCVYWPGIISYIKSAMQKVVVVREGLGGWLVGWAGRGLEEAMPGRWSDGGRLSYRQHCDPRRGRIPQVQVRTSTDHCYSPSPPFPPFMFHNNVLKREKTTILIFYEVFTSNLEK